MQQRVSVVSQVGFGQTCFPSVSRMLSHSQSLPYQHRSVNTASVVNLILAFHRLLPNHAHCEQRLFSGFAQCSRITGVTVLLRSENRGGGNKPGASPALACIAPSAFTPSSSRVRTQCPRLRGFYPHSLYPERYQASEVPATLRFNNQEGNCCLRPKTQTPPPFPGCAPFLRVFRPHTG